MSASQAAPVLPQRRTRSFEELFEAQRQVSRKRRAYPRKCVEDLLAWLTEDAKKVVAAGRELFQAKASSDAADFSARASGVERGAIEVRESAAEHRELRFSSTAS